MTRAPGVSCASSVTHAVCKAAAGGLPHLVRDCMISARHFTENLHEDELLHEPDDPNDPP